MSGPGYQVVVARLMENGHDDPAVKAEFNKQFGTLMNIIRTTYSATMITDVKSLDLRTMFRPKVILLVTEEITKPANVSKLHTLLAKYVQTGGTLILCCWFITMSTAWAIEGFLWEFTHDWKIAESTEEYERTNLRLNPSTAMKEKFGSDAFKFIEKSYAITAVHLRGVARDDQIYVSAKELDYPGFQVTGMFHDTTPSAFRKHGSGYLGYVGDTKLGHGTQALVVAMLEAAMRSGIPNNSKPPRQIHPLPQRTPKSLDTSKSDTHNTNPSVVSTQRAPESHPDRIANLVVTSSQATATTIQPTQPHPKVALLPSMLPVTRNDITALHRFEKERSDSLYTNDSYGGGFQTPSIHTDLSGPPPAHSEGDDYPLADVWNTAGTEIHCPSDEEQAPPCHENGADLQDYHKNADAHTSSEDKERSGKRFTSNGVFKRSGGEDDDSLYNASINGSNDKTETVHAAPNTRATSKPSPHPPHNENSHNNDKNRHEIRINNHADPSPNSTTKPSNTTLVHYHNNITHPPDPDAMPALTACNPGCAVCTILLPAMKCVACKKVQYCSATCQRVDWEEHRVVCKAQAQARVMVNGNRVGF